MNTEWSWNLMFEAVETVLQYKTFYNLIDISNQLYFL